MSQVSDVVISKTCFHFNLIADSTTFIAPKRPTPTSTVYDCLLLWKCRKSSKSNNFKILHHQLLFSSNVLMAQKAERDY